MDPKKLKDLPVDPRTKEPLPPRAQPGYYPDHHVLEQQAFWDEATRRMVLDRVNDVPPLRFFSKEDAELYRAVFDRLIPQDDRDEAHRIPVLNYVDERLYKRETDGYRFEVMPADWDAYKLGAEAIRTLAHELHDKRFEDLNSTEQDELLKSLHDGKPRGAHAYWEKMPAHRFFLLVMHDAARAYYSHPWAWDEVGFGGPAYPRGYMRLGGQPEPWEGHEKRYEWEAPPSARSGGFEQVAGTDTHGGQPGQGGTH
jgi:hypothetical protein